jgi:hypothetical protein
MWYAPGRNKAELVKFVYTLDVCPPCALLLSISKNTKFRTDREQQILHVFEKK